MLSDRARKHAAFDLLAHRHQLVGSPGVRRPTRRLFDDRALVEIGGHVMRGRADQFDAAGMRLMVSFAPLKLGRKL